MAKADLKQDQFGGRLGGPIVIPGLLDGRNKAFFFFNYEELEQPSDVTRNNRNFLNAEAASGIYRYTTAGGGVQTVNLLQLAAANGQLATLDPTVSQLLTDITDATAGGSLAAVDNNIQRFSFNVPVAVEAPVSDGPHRLQHHRQAPLQQRVELQLVHGLPRYAEQP